MMNAEAAPEILTPEQAASYLQVTRETVYRFIREGKLDASRLGRAYRIPRRNVELLLLATRTRPDITLREYSLEEIEQFLEDDILEGPALAVAQQFERATGGTFFKESPEVRRPDSVG